MAHVGSMFFPTLYLEAIGLLASGATRTGVLYANSQYDLLTPRQQNAVDVLIMSRLYPRLSFEITFLQDLFVTYIDSLVFRCITSS